MKAKSLGLLFVTGLLLSFSPQLFSAVTNSQPHEADVIDAGSIDLSQSFIKPDVKSMEVVLYFQSTDLPDKSVWLIRDLSKNHFTGEKKIVVDPVKHTWTAYAADGKALRSGMATAGAAFCPDIGRGCRTKIGVFRIQSLGSAGCRSHKFPLPYGGAPMPYCMFFNGGQGLHGSYNVVRGNVSHGCVRLKVEDAKWIRFNFATVGTKVIIKSY